MAYGRSPIAPYYLNTIAKAKAEERMLEKKIQAQKEEAAKDRWLRAGMGVADIGARFGMQAYSDYLKSEQKKADLVGPVGAVAGQGDAALKAKQVAAQKAAAPSAISGVKSAMAAAKPPPSLERLDSVKREKQDLAQSKLLDPEAAKKAPYVPIPYSVDKETGKVGPIDEAKYAAAVAATKTQVTPSAPKAAKKMVEENPEAAAPPTKADDPVASWSKRHYAYLNGVGEHPGMPPEVTDRTLESRGLLQSDGSRIGMAELRKKHPNDREFRDAVYASKLMERNQLDVQYKRAQIEKLAYDKRMRPARFLDESVTLQNKVLSGKISLENARQNYQKLLFAVEQYNRGEMTGKGKNRRYLPPKVKIEMSGEHHLFKPLPNIHIPAGLTATTGPKGETVIRKGKKPAGDDKSPDAKFSMPGLRI